MPLHRVISVGGNPELLWLRHAVLENAGFHVITALGEDEALAAVRASTCDTLLVCYSLGKEARESLAQDFRQRCPRGRIVAITNRQLDAPDYADTFVYGVEGPEVLIETLLSGEGDLTAQE
jgi:DNA-binding NarL/FixJ family response regulator